MRKLLIIFCIFSICANMSFGQKNKPKSAPKEPATQETIKSKPVFNFNAGIPDSSFRIKLKTPSYKEGLTYLCYHWGKNLNIEDSGMIDKDGEVVFSGNRKLPGGIYAIVFPGKRLTFDFFVDNKKQDISIYADSANLQNVQIKGSDENNLFQDYQKFVVEKGSVLQDARTSYTLATTKSDSAFHEARYNQANAALNNYRDSIMKNHPESMMALFLNAMREPEILHKKPETRTDSIENYDYYKAHFWDGITFRDERVLRTPFFLPKLEKYYNDIIIQAADTLKKDLDYKLLLARSCPEMFKFLLNWYTDYYLNPKYMGHDAVFVHLFEKYHSKGVSNWLNEKQMETITRRAYMQMANLIGAQGANLEMIDSTGKQTNLYDVKADYVLMCFWDPSCGHCKEELPRIDSIYRAFWKLHGVKIYAVLNDPDKKKEWVNYIKENKIGDWIHVYQTAEMEKAITDAQKPSYRQLYDVIQTPTLLLLDKEKRIIGKRLGFLQLNELLRSKLGYLPVSENKPVTITKPSPKPIVSSNPENGNIETWDGNGTGFFINENGYIATNYHVIEGARSIQIQLNQGRKKLIYYPRIVKVDMINDLAILKIEDEKFVPLKKIQYNFKDTVSDVGTSVFTLGFPRATVMGEELKYTSGEISSKTGVKNDPTKYQISVPIQPGNSGGPLFDFNCNLIGVTSSGLRKDIYYDSENVNYAIKSAILKNLIDVLPGDINTPNQKNINIGKSKTDLIKILSEYIVIIKTKY